MKDIDLVKELATECICPNTHQANTLFEFGAIKNYTYFGMLVLNKYKEIHNIDSTE